MKAIRLTAWDGNLATIDLIDPNDSTVTVRLRLSIGQSVAFDEESVLQMLFPRQTYVPPNNKE